MPNLELDRSHPIFDKPIHSREITPCADCNEVSKHDIERVLGIRGFLAHLNSLGWNQYQWQYYPVKKIEQYPSLNLFVEVFGSRYESYIHCNSKVSLIESAQKVIAIAQRYAACDKHDYQPYKGFENGLMACSKCGFNGHSTLVGVDKTKIDYMTVQLSLLRESHNDLISRLHQWGISCFAFNDRIDIDQTTYQQALQDHTENSLEGK